MRTRPAGLAITAALAVLASVPATAAGQPQDAVDVEAALRAAQIDPQRDDQEPTPGAQASVEVIERALRAEGLLDQQYVDGHYGTRTVDAYAEHQRSMGFEGIAANGLPGAESLRELAAGRFEVTRVVRPGKRTTHTGEVVNARTAAMLAEAEERFGAKFAVDQGSYNPGGDPTSAGTHDGGGAVDVDVDGMDRATSTEAVRALREVGFAAWYRTPSQGDWPAHIHAVAISDPDLSEPAREQVGDYYLGKNGLANDGPDDGPEVEPVRTWEQHQRGEDR
ncbi:peptidoglycan-binding protein [Saccharopolyspora griseoalba]|uniref:Peptidoglycan-binding protein n=1 Tax=Saccharopolyspora griseoalba TaxID=1431848 RepID=A0ABW2LPL6_9PSEU